MTKDAVAGRIRRLLAMADKRAERLGVPDTEASLTPGHARRLSDRSATRPAPGCATGTGSRLAIANGHGPARRTGTQP